MSLRSRLNRTDRASIGVWPDSIIEPPTATDVVAIRVAARRVPVSVEGKIRSIRVQPRAGTPTLAVRIFDDSGHLTIVFNGRRSILGMEPGRHIEAHGVIGEHHGTAAMRNPAYRLRG